MNTRAINAAADVICRAQKNGTVTPTGLALALESAGLLLSPEIAQDIAASRAAERLSALLAPAESREDRYRSPLRHDYRVSHDLPEVPGGAA